MSRGLYTFASVRVCECVCDVVRCGVNATHERIECETVRAIKMTSTKKQHAAAAPTKWDKMRATPRARLVLCCVSVYVLCSRVHNAIHRYTLCPRGLGDGALSRLVHVHAGAQEAGIYTHNRLR